MLFTHLFTQRGLWFWSHACAFFSPSCLKWGDWEIMRQIDEDQLQEQFQNQRVYMCVSSTPDVLSTLVNTPPTPTPSSPSPSARPERRLVLLTRQGHPVRHSRWGMDARTLSTHIHLQSPSRVINFPAYTFVSTNLRLPNVNTDSLEQHRSSYCRALTHIRRLLLFRISITPLW